MRLCSRSYKHPEHWGCECGVQFSEPAFSLMARPLQVLCCLISSNHFFLNACIFYPNLRVDLIGRVFHTLCHGVNEKCRCQAKDAAVIKPSSHSSSPKARPEGTRDGDKQAACLLASPQPLLLPHLGTP